MSEEQKVETPAVDAKAAEGDEVVQSQASPEEERASTRGWMPKEQWVEAGHNEADWKPAKVFIEHGDMIGKIRALEKRTAEADRALQFMHQKNQQIYQTGYDAALKQLRSEKRQALAEGDLVKADEIDERIDLTKQELHKAVSTPPPKVAQVDPEHAEWLQRNSWYNDGVMQKFADALAIEYIRVNNGQVGANDVRDFVEKEVKKEFAHKFKKTTTAAPNPDGDGRAGSSQSNKNTALDSRLAKAKAEMSEEQRSIMKTMLRTTGLTEKKYLELYLN